MELGLFLCSCNFFRRINRTFAKIVAPLYRQLKKKQRKSFEPSDENERAALKALKGSLISLTVLALPENAWKFTLETTAFDEQTGWVLLQGWQAINTRPVRYWSHIPTHKEHELLDTQIKSRVVVWSLILLLLYLRWTCSNAKRRSWRTPLDTHHGRRYTQICKFAS